MEERLIEIFKEYLPAWSWEEWQAAGSSDKEDIVINALADLGPDVDIEVDEAYDIFYDWIVGLTEADFRSDLDETVTPEEKARVAAENEARRQKQAELEAESRARAKERSKQLAIQRAEDAIAKDVIDEYNKYWRKSILSTINPDVYPAIDPETKELVFDMAEKKRILDSIGLEEAVRVVSDPDVLYHATEVGPFYDILNSGVMLHDVRNEGGVHAICFTTDDSYTIYGYPCKIKFSRSKLEQDGYELYPVDEFEDDEYGRGESEERCDQDINDVRKYVTEVIIDWEFVAVAQDGDDCRLSTGEYDEEGNESDNWDLRLSDFQALLDSLKASGIKVIENGQPEADDEYWFDETGEFKYGREPALV